MAQHKFDNYIFDDQSQTLKYKGKAVSIRPKTRQLLLLLILNKHRLVSKLEISQKIWGESDVRDYLLFQVVSEIRKLPCEEPMVRTVPNKGYRWSVLTSCKQSRKILRKVAASVMVFITGLLLFILPITKDPKQAFRLPAHEAFSKGIVALETGNNEEAIKWLEFSLIENNESNESRLFLAEAFYLNQQTEAALIQIQTVLKNPTASAYSKMTATDLLSQISQQQGFIKEALMYAQNVQQSALKPIFQTSPAAKLKQTIRLCSANMIVDRIVLLQNMLDTQAVNNQPRLVNKQIAQEQEQQNIASINKETNDYIKQCDELNKKQIETSLLYNNDATKIYAHKPYLARRIFT